MGKKLLVTPGAPVQDGDKLKERYAELFGLEPDDVVILPAGMSFLMVDVPEKKAKAKVEGEPGAAEGEAVDLESMTVEELHAKATKDGTSLHGATLKADIIKAMKKAEKAEHGK